MTSAHPDEYLLSTYADGELDGPGRGELEAHLVQCRECRTRVVALQDESLLLSDVLSERERPARVREPVPLAEADVAVGAPLAIAAVTVAFAFVGWVLETRIPGGLDILNPLRLTGAYEMAFDFLFFLRDSVPGILELLLSVGAVASFSALLTFGVGLVYRRIFGVAASVALALVLVAPETARAIDLNVDEEVHVERDTTIERSLLVTGERARIDGVVKGDLVASVARLQITGRIEGNLYVLTRDLDLSGRVDGTIHSIAERARIDGDVHGSLFAISRALTVTEAAKVARDAWLLLHRGVLDGEFGQDMLIGGDEVEIGGRVARDVDLRFVEEGRIRRTAEIGGNLDWTDDWHELEQHPDAKIGGEIRVHEGEEPLHETWRGRYVGRFYLVQAIGFVASLAFGLLIYWLMPSLYDVGIRDSRDFLRSLLFGLVLLVVPPAAIVAIALTLVGLPIAVLGLFVYVTCLYAAELLVGAWLGRTLLGQEDGSFWSFAKVLFVGFLLVSVGAHLPFVGTPIVVVCILAGLGLVFERARRLPIFAA